MLIVCFTVISVYRGNGGSDPYIKKTQVIYIAAPFVQAVLIAVSFIGVIAPFGFDDMGKSYIFIFPHVYLWAIEFILIMIFAFKGIVFTVKCKTEPVVELNSEKKSYKRSTPVIISSVLGTVSVIAEIILMFVAALKMSETLTAGNIIFIILAVFISCLTMGIGFAAIAVIMPFYTWSLPAAAAYICMPYAVSASAFGGAFFSLHTFTVIYMICSLKQLRNKNILDENQVKLLGIASAVPIVNIFTSTYLTKKIKAFDN